MTLSYSDHYTARCRLVIFSSLCTNREIVKEVTLRKLMDSDVCQTAVGSFLSNMAGAPVTTVYLCMAWT